MLTRRLLICLPVLSTCVCAQLPTDTSALEGQAAIAARGFETTGYVTMPTAPGKPSPSSAGPAISYVPAPGATPESAPALRRVSMPVTGDFGVSAVALELPSETSAPAEAAPAPIGVEPVAPTPSTVLEVKMAASVELVPVVPAVPPGWVEPALPAADLLAYPNSDGLVSIGAESISAARAQNPFDVRYVPPGTTTDIVLDVRSCVLRVVEDTANKEHGTDRSIAYINEKPAMRGDRVAAIFTLTSIRRREVVLERAGRYYVLPIAKKTTIRLAMN